MTYFSVRFLLFAATIVAALFLAGMLSYAAAGRIWLPPFVLLAALAWLPAFPLSRRLWLAGGAGGMIDAVSDMPFGTNVLLLLAASLLIGAISTVFSDQRSAMRRLGTWVAVAVFMMLLTPLARASAAFLQALLP